VATSAPRRTTFICGSFSPYPLAQHLADLRKRCARPEHLGRGRVPQLMRADPRQARPVARRADDPPDRASVQLPARRGHPQEQRPTLAPRATAKIGHQRLADIDGQRQHVVTAALAADEQLAAAPFNIIELEPSDLAGAQPEPRQQHLPAHRRLQSDRRTRIREASTGRPRLC